MNLNNKNIIIKNFKKIKKNQTNEKYCEVVFGPSILNDIRKVKKVIQNNNK